MPKKMTKQESNQLKEMVKMFEEHVMCNQKTLDEGYEEIPEIVLDKLKENIKYAEMIDKSEKKYKARLAKDAKETIKKQLELEKRSVVHCTDEGFQKLIDEATGQEKEHLIRWQQVYMPMTNAYFKGLFDNLWERFKPRYVQKYRETTRAEKRMLKKKKLPVVDYSPMFDTNGKPVMEERVIMYAEEFGSQKYYLMYYAEILERLLRDNVKEYKKKITKK